MFRAEFALRMLATQANNVYIVSFFACCRQKFKPKDMAIFISKDKAEELTQKHGGETINATKKRSEVKQVMNDVKDQIVLVRPEPTETSDCEVNLNYLPQNLLDIWTKGLE